MKLKKKIDKDTEIEVDAIDREQENKDVALYQRTKDERIIEKVFKNRIPTLRHWAYKHYFPGLSTSLEDFYGELIIVFVKAVDHYNIERGNFNTCLYTFLLNRIKNIKSGKYAKKRKPLNYDGPISGIMLSMDYSENDEDSKLIDRLDSELVTNNNIFKNIEMEDYLDILCNGNKKLKKIFVKIGEGNSISSIIKECKNKEGKISIENIKDLNKETIIRTIEKSIGNHVSKLIFYEVNGNELAYKVECKKTEDSELFSKAIRNLKKNRDYYIKKIKSN